MISKHSQDIIEMHRGNKAHYARAMERQLSVWNGQCPMAEQPLLLSSFPEDGAPSIPRYNYKEIHWDEEKMLLHGLVDTLAVAHGGGASIPSVRANMGCGIFPTLFGIEQMVFEDKMPWVKQHLPKDILSNMKASDLKIGPEFDMALKHMAYLADAVEGSGIHVYPLDLQGAFDTAHIVYGDAIFYDLYDDPEFVHHLLDLSCAAIFLGMKAVFELIPESDKVVTHYNNVVLPRSKGGVKISEDTSTLLSGAQIKEFVTPYLSRILEHFGGGYVHYCGVNPHLFSEVMNIPKAYGINFGNPEKHDMVSVLKACAEKGIVYYGYAGDGRSFEELLRASRRPDGGSALLLNMACGAKAREDVLDKWARAAEAAARG